VGRRKKKKKGRGKKGGKLGKERERDKEEGNYKFQ